MDGLYPPPTALRDFRTHFSACLDRRADALFELMDAALTAGPRPSLAHLSLAGPHRRDRGSLCAALQDGRMDMDDPRALLAASPDCRAAGLRRRRGRLAAQQGGDQR
jgi:hypothetical protein